MTIDLMTILQVLGPAAAVYAAIRADLARIHERATNAHESATRAHARIDDLQKVHQ